MFLYHEFLVTIKLECREVFDNVVNIFSGTIN